MPNLTANPAEQRRGLRKSTVHEQICLVELGADRSAMLLDISELGFGVQCVQGIPEAPTTTFRFLLPGSPAIVTGEGEIAWSDLRGRMGVRFTKVAPEMMKEVRDWVNSEANPLFEDPVETEAVVDEDARDRVAQLEARIMMSGWAEVQSLNFLVDQVAAMTQASGVAIAVEDGNGIVCKASSGIAPQVGVRINSRSGLSWECARTGDVVHCVDTENDPRVDRMVCRELNMRSAMLVPVIRNGRVTGLVEVFSSRPRAFSTNTIILLKRVAEAVGALDELSGLLDVEEPLIPPPPEVQPTAVLRPETPVAAPVRPPQPITPPVTAPTSEAAAAVKPAPIDVPKPTIVPAPAAIPTAAKSVPPTPAPVPPAPPSPPQAKMVAAVTEVKQAPKPEIESPKKAEVAQPSVPKTFSIKVPIPTAAPESSAPARAAGVPVPTPKPAPATPVQPAASAPTPVPAPAKAPAAQRAVVKQETTATVASTPARTAPPAAKPIVKPVPPVEKPRAAVAEKPAPVAEKPKAAVAPEPELFSSLSHPQPRSSKLGIGIAAAVVVLAVGAYEGRQWLMPVPGAKTAAVQTQQKPVTPPAVGNLPAATTPPASAAAAKQPAPAAAAHETVASPGQSSTATVPPKAPVRQPAIAVEESSAPLHVPIPRPIQALPASAPNTPAPIPAPSNSGMANILSGSVVVPKLSHEEISQGVSGGKQLSRTEPVYPASARAMRLFGVVVLRAHVNTSGTVSSVEVVTGNPMLVAPAVAAVRRWRYSPFLLNGKPIENVVTIQIKFNEP